jgi:hypothetical protein
MARERPHYGKQFNPVNDNPLTGCGPQKFDVELKRTCSAS